MYELTSLLFFIWIFRNSLFWGGLWQNKEYRLDRLLVHFTETTKGKEVLFSFISLLKWVGILAYGFVFFNPDYSQVLQLFVALLYTYEASVVFREVQSRKLKRPVFTFRALAIVSLSLFIISVLYAIPFLQSFVWLLILDRMLIFIIAFFVFALAIPSEFVKDIRIEQARKKISEHKNVLVIGISGSYGKSSTKEYLAHILSQKFKVLKTKGSENTPMGIARAITSGLKKETQIFVAELGSYKRYELAELCHIVHPKISITTAISDQHLSLFGSYKNILETEYELIASLPKDGIALFNANGENIFDLYQRTKRKKVLYGVSSNGEVRKKKLNISATNIIVKKRSVVFDVLLGSKKISFEAPLLGKHTVENILPGIYLGKHLGMHIADIRKAIETLKPLPKTMVFYRAKKAFAVVDDSFNASPESVMAAIDYMKVYSGKRFLVFEPMIELGKNARENHYKLGREISKYIDHLLLTNKNFYDAIAQGVKDGKGQCTIDVYTPDEIARFVKRNAKHPDVVLLEGREAGMTLSKIL